VSVDVGALGQEAPLEFYTARLSCRRCFWVWHPFPEDGLPAIHMLLIAYRRLWRAKRTAKDMPRYIFALDTMDARASGVKFASETSALRDATMVADVRVEGVIVIYWRYLYFRRLLDYVTLASTNLQDTRSSVVCSCPLCVTRFLNCCSNLASLAFISNYADTRFARMRVSSSCPCIEVWVTKHI
jgi:hypothetical protein